MKLQSYIKIKHNNRASNEPYNLCEFFKIPIKDSFLSIHFPSILRWTVIEALYFDNLF